MAKVVEIVALTLIPVSYTHLVGGNGTVVTDALKRLWVQPLIGQIVVGDAVLFHISPHRFKRHWHEITPTLL